MGTGRRHFLSSNVRFPSRLYSTVPQPASTRARITHALSRGLAPLSLRAAARQPSRSRLSATAMMGSAQELFDPTIIC